MWYVIQVINGREDVMRERIERMVPASAMQELFYPQFQTEIKVHGEWVDTTKPLFPGYLICDTADPRTVQQYLLRMDDFARVLSQDGQFVPLAKEEVQLIGGFTHWSGKDKLDFLLRILKRIAARIPLETCSPGWNACAPYCNRALCT